jgi:acyl carrier protein
MPDKAGWRRLAIGLGSERPLGTRVDQDVPAERVRNAALNSRSPFAIRAIDLSGGLGALRRLSRDSSRVWRTRKNAIVIRDLEMPSTFDTVVNIITETCDIPRETIKLESHAINDLGIDSLDFLDIAFAIDKTFGIKMPLEQWTQEVNEGKATTEQYFVLQNLCARIDDLVAAKRA